MMKQFLAWLVFVWLISACQNQEVNHTKITGIAVAVADGDTFTLLTPEKKQIKVRLYGIDCPEKRQDFGAAARRFLSNAIFQKPLQIQVKGTDRYGRMLAVVYTGEEKSVNEALLAAGMAWHYKEYDKNPHWRALEAEARNKKIGIWSQPHPIYPADFRKQQRSKK